MYFFLSLSIFGLTRASIPIAYGDTFFVQFPFGLVSHYAEDRPGTAQIEFGMPEQYERLLSFGNRALSSDAGSLVSYNGYVRFSPTEILRDNESRYLILSGGRDHGFFYRNGGVVLVPTSATAGVMILEPIDPSQNALDNQLFYSRSVRNSNWGFRATVRLINSGQEDMYLPDDTEFGICSFKQLLPRSIPNIPSFLTVPARVFEQLIERLELEHVSGTQVRTVFYGFGFILANFNDSLFDILPHIQYMAETDSHLQVSIGTLEPRDYVTQLPDGSYYLRLKPSGPGEDFCTIDGTLLRKMVVHFDPYNGRIGFGEPVLEL